MGENIRVGHPARVLAFRVVIVFLVGTLVGSLAPESGNVLAYWIGLPYLEGHAFNPCFLAVGILGIVLACVFGHKKRK